MSFLVDLLEFISGMLYANAATHAMIDLHEEIHRTETLRDAAPDERTPCAKCGFMVHAGEDVCPVCGTPTRASDRKRTEEDGIKRARHVL